MAHFADVPPNVGPKAQKKYASKLYRNAMEEAKHIIQQGKHVQDANMSDAFSFWEVMYASISRF